MKLHTKNKSVKTILLVLFLLSVFIQKGNSSSQISQKLEIDTNPNVEQQISILVGPKKLAAKAGENPEIDPPLNPGESPSPSTSNAGCETGRCCFQYTWQGYIQEDDVPKDPANATCEFLRSQKRDDSIACFDPMVYTTGTTGNSPNIKELQVLADEEGWPIYCPLTGAKTCMSLRYYSRGKNRLVNETRFCGSVTETITGNKISSGCYKEKAKGYIREVCVCDQGFCNSVRTFSSKLFLKITGFIIIWMLFI